MRKRRRGRDLMTEIEFCSCCALYTVLLAVSMSCIDHVHRCCRFDLSERIYNPRMARNMDSLSCLLVLNRFW